MKKLELEGFWININSQKTNFIILSLKNFDTFIWNIRLDIPENNCVKFKKTLQVLVKENPATL